ncbi:protein ECT2-like isoform X2 [Clavelina lepadiformis]|uniref:protein ECT2-like isoform X2 n=1 Tax=Clavelina lepadiformis TaxID=159417 RepID=UPI004040EA75
MEISQASSNQSLKLSSTTTSDASNDVHERHPSIETRVCLVGAVTKNEDLKEKLKDLKIPYLISNDGKEYKDEDDPYFETIFILEDFEGELFEELKRSDNRLLGPPVISSIAVTNEPLPYTCRPLYCTCMHGLNLCFTNFKTKDHLAHLVTLCHYMGACIRKDMSAKIDFLVTNSLHGPKFRTAVSLGTPVMKEEWIHRCWAARRRDKLYQATDDEFLTPCKSKPFEGCTLSFLGFSDAEEKDMEEQAKEQGGIVAAVGDTSCTHLIVEEINVKKLPFEPEGRLYIVVQEWFWGSIQIEAKAAESMYIFELVEYPKMLTRSSTTSSLLGTPKWRGSTSNLRTRSRGSTGKSFSRKRSRLREETLAKLAQESENDPSRPPRKRPSTDTSACVPDSMLDMSNNTTIASLKSPNTPERQRSARLRSRRRLESIPDIFDLCEKNCNSVSVCQRGLVPTSSLVLSPYQQPGTGHSVPDQKLDGQVNSVEGNEESIGPRIYDEDIDSNVLNQSAGVTERRKYRKRKSSESPNNAKEAKGVFESANGSTNDFNKCFSSSVIFEEPENFSDKHVRRFSFVECGFRKGRFSAASGALKRFSLLKDSGKFKPILEHGIGEVEEDNYVDMSERDSFGRTSKTITNNAENCIQNDFDTKPRQDKVASPKPAVTSARYQVAMEFLNTEKNYVGILQTILNLFKKPLDDPNQAGGPILASEDMKAIFSSLPEIEAVHRSMNNDLQCLMAKWNDTSCIGTLVLKYADEFGRCYPSFVNFFEVSVDTISQCEARSARFHAFLKINQAKRECGRQTLAELLINPVQRLPRIILLLQDIKKHTERENSSHPDVASISNALDALKEVMTYINEDKRKTESQRQIFDIVYEVDGCPPTIVSSHRRFVARAELLAIDDNLCSRGDNISLFIFSDCVEIAKRRRGMKANNFKSPNVHARPTANAKSLKHVKLMSLFHIKKVVNINDSDECENAVALYCRTPTDTQDWLYMFKVLFCSEDNSAQPKEDSKRDNKENENETEGDTGKGQLLRILARHRASALCKAVDDNFVCAVNPHELDVNTTDLGSTLGRAVRAAKKSSRKLTRAFSFTRTPKRVVQRAVSNMLSPSQQRPPTGLFRTESATSRDLEHDDTSSVASSLTPSMSVTSLCTPQRDCRGNRLSSTCDDDPMQVEYVQSPMLKTSVSTLTLARPPTAADLSDFPAVPTPPARRRKLGSTIKAATVAFGRTGSFRRRNNTTKYESAV